jgi:hypothetical protein
MLLGLNPKDASFRNKILPHNMSKALMAYSIYKQSHNKVLTHFSRVAITRAAML